MGNNPLWYAISLFAVLGLIFFMFFMMKKMNRLTRTASGSRLRIIDRANTGRDSSLLVVSVSGRLMLVGVSAGRIEKLCDLDIDEEEYFDSSDQPDKPALNFSDVLKNYLKLNKTNHKLTEKIPKTEGEEPTVEPDIKS
ncbi:MAG: flagellar biosynthetic protein FliO [Oscillospiraceae bacterium]|jgi:flagellar protein FliO/FliZ|nr:flagellar biosynthetic protein FliO [Oscillospiraceae bacterium]